jgi:hypothetical protein
MSEGAGRKGMSDIVERLRSADVLIVKSATDLRSVVAEEAADEIEKLREERRAMQGALRAIMAHTSSAHPMSYMADLWRIARAALGEKQ